MSLNSHKVLHNEIVINHARQTKTNVLMKRTQVEVQRREKNVWKWKKSNSPKLWKDYLVLMAIVFNWSLVFNRFYSFWWYFLIRKVLAEGFLYFACFCLIRDYFDDFLLPPLKTRERKWFQAGTVMRKEANVQDVTIYLMGKVSGFSGFSGFWHKLIKEVIL